MAEDKKTPTGKRRSTGTLMLRAQDAADARAAKLREEERARDAVQEQRTDAAYCLALDAAEKRAKAAEERVSEQAVSHTKKERFQWLIILVLVLSLIGIAGYKVAGNFLGLGNVEIGGAEPVEEPKKAPKIDRR